MILTKTFLRRGQSVELRVYVPWLNADEVNETTNEVTKLIIQSLDPEKLDMRLPKSALTICSNRAGLHYAHQVDCRSITYQGRAEQMDAAEAKLKAAGWKECKGA